ncbi:MAG: hypothetical protein MP439_10675, partial [Ferrimicrobium sp.]|nr:hypothetical protein [Ferrimicrobium sp.]
SLLCRGQEFADPIEGIPASASVAKDVVLYPSSGLVKASIGELYPIFRRWSQVPDGVARCPTDVDDAMKL